MASSHADPVVPIAMLCATPGKGLTRTYRPAELEAEIRALPEPTDAGFCAALEHAPSPEALVYGIRQVQRAGDAAAAQALLVRLIERATPAIAAHLKRMLGFAGQDHEDAAQDVTIRLWREIQDLSPHAEYWEAQFARKLKLTCIDAAQAIFRRRRHERPFAHAGDDEGETWDEEATLADPVPIDTGLLVPEALAQLAGKYRQAMSLHLLGFQATSNDPHEPTIAGQLGVTDRSVRTYLRRAEEIIRAWYAARTAPGTGTV